MSQKHSAGSLKIPLRKKTAATGLGANHQTPNLFLPSSPHFLFSFLVHFLTCYTNNDDNKVKKKKKNPPAYCLSFTSSVRLVHAFNHNRGRHAAVCHFLFNPTLYIFFKAAAGFSQSLLSCKSCC